MPYATPMDEDHEKVADMRHIIQQGDYRVEPVAVAEAILHRLRELAVARAERVRSDERAWAAEHPLRANAQNLRARPASR
jgi:Anti-sigma-28 factor, FlgM